MKFYKTNLHFASQEWCFNIMPTQRHYAAALNEILEQKPSLGLFAECFAKSEGDEQRTKAAYIEKRALELEHLDFLAIKAEQERREACKKAEEQRLEKLKRDKLAKIAELNEKYSLKRFIEENQETKHLKYYNKAQIKEMHANWLKDKLREEGL